MALTLLEAAKLHSGDVLRSTIIKIYAMQSDILRTVPFENIAGNALKYNLEDTLPGVGFRGINEAYTESTGIINPQVEQLVIAGGDLDVDKFLVKTMGQDQRSSQEAMKLKALAHKWSHTFIKGDSTTNPKEFDGLQIRIGGAQLISNGATSGGDPLSLAKLDELIDLVDDPSALIMNKALRRRLTAAARNPNVAGYITYSKDEFGRRVVMYNDLPILIADGNRDVYQTLAFNEAGAGGGSTATSIYCVSYGDEQLQGIQNGPPEVEDLGELDTKPVLRTRVEWYNGLTLKGPRAAARLRSISDAAVVV